MRAPTVLSLLACLDTTSQARLRSVCEQFRLKRLAIFHDLPERFVPSGGQDYELYVEWLPTERPSYLELFQLERALRPIFRMGKPFMHTRDEGRMVWPADHARHQDFAAEIARAETLYEAVET